MLCVNTSCIYIMMLERIGVMLSLDFLFPRFLVFPPANPIAIFHFANVFLPDSLSFSVQKYYFVRYNDCYYWMSINYWMCIIMLNKSQYNY